MTFYRWLAFLFCFNLLVLNNSKSFSQMRQVYLDNVEGNEVRKISFYSASEGYVAFRDWIGYTTDTGRTFTKKYVTLSNVDLNGFSVNLTFGFGIKGVKAFAKNSILVYGDYGFVPAILYSNNGGSSFKLIFQSRYNVMELNGGITDMIFPQNGNIGYAVDADRVLKTTDQGLTWSVCGIYPGSFFTNLDAADNNTVLAFSNSYNTNKLLKTIDGGTTWQPVVLPNIPVGRMIYAHFLSSTNGWLSMYDTDNNGYIFKTINGGGSWILQNNIVATSFYSGKMKFLNDSIGYSLGYGSIVYKTSNSGGIWEPLADDIKKDSLYYTDFQFLNNNQFWAGGSNGLLKLSTNGGGIPSPKAYFRVDTVGLFSTSKVNLVNHSKIGYTYKWFLNNTQISSLYSTSYVHDINRLRDTIQLVVSNGTNTDTIIKYQYFYPPVTVTSFTPSIGTVGTSVTINGTGFYGAVGVLFGGVAAKSFTIISATQIVAIVDSGATGNVTVNKTGAAASIGTFTYFAPPTINLATSISKNILCKSESIAVVIQNTQPNVRYDLIDSLNNSYGYVNSIGGTATINTLPIYRTGNYRIKASRLNITSVNTFTNKLFIVVEQTKSIVTVSKVNVITGEKLNFDNHSVEAQSFSWIFNQDANLSSSSQKNVQNIFYPTAGQKTFSLVSTSANGCKDTLLDIATFAFNKLIPDDACYVQNIDDSDWSYTPYSPTSIGKVLLANDNGYYIYGAGNRPKLKSRLGLAKQLTGDGTAYFAKYSTDGVLSWHVSIRNASNFYSADKDDLGNVYIVGSANTTSYLTFTNGDSIRISAAPSDTISYLTKQNGFIVKLDSLGNYIWHTVTNNPSQIRTNFPVGCFPTKIKISSDNIIVTGSFGMDIAYWQKGVLKATINLPDSVSNYGDYTSNFIFKITSDGTLLWKTYIENISVNQRRDISGVGIDSLNNFLICGYYEERAVIHDVGNLKNITYNGFQIPNGSYLIKLDANGHLIWNVNMTNSNRIGGSVSIKDLVTDKAGNSYVTGSASLLNNYEYFVVNNSDGSNQNVSLARYFLLKFSPSGVYKWGVGSKYSYYGQGNAVCLKNNDIYTIGTLSDNGVDSAKFVMTSNDSNHISQQFYAASFFVANYDTSGVLKRVVQSGVNIGGHNVPTNIVVDANKNYIISGIADNFNGGNGTFSGFNNTVRTNGIDGYFAKLNTNYCYTASLPTVNAGFNRTKCSGDTVMLGTKAISGYGYLWSSKGPEFFSSNIANPIVSPTSSTTYYLTIINSAGFISRDSVVITIKQSPIADAGVDQNICTGTSTNIGSASIANNSYSWTSNPSGFSSTIANPLISPTVNTQYYLSVTNTIGCTKKDTVAIKLFNTLVPSVTVVPSNTSVCAGTNVTFTASALNSGNNPTYQWQVNGTNVGTNSNIFITNSLSSGNNVKVIVTSNASCALPTTATSNILAITINPIVTPSVILTALRNNVCLGTTVDLNTVITNGGISPTYQWYKNGVSFTGSIPQSYYSFIDLVDGDQFYVKMTSNASCLSSTIATSNTVAITVSPTIPIVTISGNTTVTKGLATIISSTTNGNVSGSYLWEDSTKTHSWQNITGNNNSSISYIPIATGDKIRCTFFRNNICTLNSNAAISNVLTFTVNNATAIIPVPASGLGIKSFPNPVKSLLTIDNLRIADKWETISIVNAEGKQVYISKSINSMTKISLNVEALSTGYYVAILNRAKGAPVYIKFLKE